MESYKDYRSNLTHLHQVSARGLHTKGQGMGVLLHALILVTNAKNVLEIGTGEGYTAIAMALALSPGGMVYTLDKNPDALNINGIGKSACKDIERFKLERKITFIVADSKYYKWTGPDLDILYIDGHHSCEMTLSDYNRFSPYVKKDGLILFHDISHPHWGNDVKKALDKINCPCFRIHWNFGLAICQK